VVDLQELSVSRPYLSVVLRRCRGGFWNSSGTIGLASRVSVPRGSSRKLEESESPMLTSYSPSVVAMKEEDKDYKVSGKDEGAVIL
jgi:hypothetical protein